jgi:hypothetical protein
MPRALSRSLPFDIADPALPWGLRRFGRQLAALQQRLEQSELPDASGATRGQRLHALGGRAPLFMLEGLSRVALGTGGEATVFGPLLGEVKVLEDGLGEVDAWWATLRAFEQHRLPAPLASWAALRHAHACGKLEGALEAGAWVEHRHLPEGTRALQVHALGRLLAEAEWPGPRKARRKLVAFLSKKLRRVHEAALQLDLGDLEHGLHELRRKVRWFSIYAACLDGAVGLDTAAAAPRGWDRYLAPEVVGNRFNQLPAAPEGVEPVLLPAPLFYALSWLIAELGAVKDRAQLTESVEAGLRATGQAGTGRKLLGSAALPQAEAATLARRMVQQALVKDRLLLRLADAVEAQG